MSTMCFSRESIFFSGKLSHNLAVSHALFTPINPDLFDSQAHDEEAIRGLSKEQLSRIIAFCNQGNSCVRKKTFNARIPAVFPTAPFPSPDVSSVQADPPPQFDIGQRLGAPSTVGLIKTTTIVPWRKLATSQSL
jgi:hypothetical protein